ncbi:MAG: enoyl-CoA hydratase/isomerase family protein [Stellaceae bacterium]|jgi:methylglutaconyl-CoA hydratase
MSALLLSTDKRGVAFVTLNRPQIRNAFDDALIGELTGTFRTLGADDNVRALVLTGAGTAFSAGGDINWMKRMAGYDEAQNIADAMGLAEMLRTLNELPKPVVARVNGAAFAGGVGLVACCDIAVAAEEAVFAVSEVRIGLVPATIAPYLVAAIGPRAARRYCLTGESFLAAEAMRLGLVHKIAPLAALDEEVEKILSLLLDGGPLSQARAKRMIAEVAGRPVTQALMAHTSRTIAEARASDEGREGLAAFLEKRKPGFRR